MVRYITDFQEPVVKVAMRLIDQAAKYIGIALATAINMLDPDTIYLCGGMMKNGEDFLNRIKKYTRERQMHLAGRHVAIIIFILRVNEKQADFDKSACFC